MSWPALLLAARFPRSAAQMPLGFPERHQYIAIADRAISFRMALSESVYSDEIKPLISILIAFLAIEN